MSQIKVSSFGAYLTSWKIGDREVLYHGSELKRGGIPLLFPNFDAGAPLPNHGFGRLSQWQLIKESENSCHLRLTDNDISPEFRQIYPYKFIADLKIKALDNQLDYVLEVQNLSQKDLPLCPALHPYWPVIHDKKSQIILNNFSEFNPQNTDWEQNPPDNTFIFTNPFIVNFPEYKLVIQEIKENNQFYFKKLQIWSQNSTFPDYNFVCFEPSTGPKNGINTNPILIKSNNTVKFHLQFQIIYL
jgi:galactose mutarotase-like enzyme